MSFFMKPERAELHYCMATRLGRCQNDVLRMRIVTCLSLQEDER